MRFQRPKGDKAYVDDKHNLVQNIFFVKEKNEAQKYHTIDK